eukprot:TRINITY_DN6428_c0_g1_i1.p1 TRINITY_DN6428_c0_g1~~TRINITY_DN6428_c0_g1_i1.p1  ORF type:complete len:349 (+),score=177.29 TRINITY_DN6428_c0_g1_i1:141-1187(+)
MIKQTLLLVVLLLAFNCLAVLAQTCNSNDGEIDYANIMTNVQISTLTDAGFVLCARTGYGQIVNYVSDFQNGIFCDGATSILVGCHEASSDTLVHAALVDLNLLNGGTTATCMSYQIFAEAGVSFGFTETALPRREVSGADCEVRIADGATGFSCGTVDVNDDSYMRVFYTLPAGVTACAAQSDSPSSSATTTPTNSPTRSMTASNTRSRSRNANGPSASRTPTRRNSVGPNPSTQESNQPSQQPSDSSSVGKVRKLEVDEDSITSKSFEITWRSPKGFDDDEVTYVIAILDEDADEAEILEQEFEDTKYKFKKLNKKTTYTASVAATSISSGETGEFDSIEVKTKKN